jgi:hypothetical protein
MFVRCRNQPEARQHVERIRGDDLLDHGGSGHTHARRTGGTALRRGNNTPLHGFIVLLRLRYDLFGKWKDTGKWADDAAANEALSGHVRYWTDQRAPAAP